MKRAPYVAVLACLAMLACALLIPQTEYSDRGIAILFGLFSFAFVFVGGLVSARRPANSVGWLMLATGTLLSVALPLGQYAGYALLRDTSLPLGREAAWMTTWLYDPALCGVVLMLLVFPTGKVGRVGAWTVLVCCASGLLVTVSHAIIPGPMDGFGDVSNPFAVSPPADAVRTVLQLSGLMLAATFLVALGSLVVRLRVARGNERLQLKWLVYSVALLAAALLLNELPLGLGDSSVGLLAVVLGLFSVPASVAVAILRHRLYDIEVVINRTLVYGSLTVMLAATYLVLVLGLRALLAPVTGESDLAVAASTLAVAALFRPLRTRIQHVVDRRFFRSRYDAERTLQGFAGQLRNELDLEALAIDLRHVVATTMQPAHVSLWLRRQGVGR